jgi:hypothetical protein
MNRAQRRHPAKLDPNGVKVVTNAARFVERARKENARLNGELSWTMIMAAVGLTMHERGKSDDKIGNFIIDVQETIDREVDAGEDALSMVKKLEEKTGIKLQIK